LHGHFLAGPLAGGLKSEIHVKSFVAMPEVGEPASRWRAGSVYQASSSNDCSIAAGILATDINVRATWFSSWSALSSSASSEVSDGFWFATRRYHTKISLSIGQADSKLAVTRRFLTDTAPDGCDRLIESSEGI
jgi:hypothetical protein